MPVSLPESCKDLCPVEGLWFANCAFLWLLSANLGKSDIYGDRIPICFLPVSLPWSLCFAMALANLFPDDAWEFRRHEDVSWPLLDAPIVDHLSQGALGRKERMHHFQPILGSDIVMNGSPARRRVPRRKRIIKGLLNRLNQAPRSRGKATFQLLRLNWTVESCCDAVFRASAPLPDLVSLLSSWS